MQLHVPWFLLPDAEQVDVGLLFWNLEKRVEKNPEKWWPGSKCFCGRTAVMWQEKVSYRCEAHREYPIASELPTGRPLIGYTGDMDLSGDYEHEW